MPEHTGARAHGRPMIIRSAEFVRGARSWSQCPDDGRPQIAFAGRSNVGKSSLINCLLGRRGLARTSRTPGRTQEINFFLINEALWFADLPGFGYAKVPEKVRRAWGRLIETYLHRAEALRAVVLLIDARHSPQRGDRQLLEWLLACEVPFIPVLTKADKLSKSQIQQRLRRLEDDAPVLAACEPVTVSAQTRLGKETLLERIEAYL